MSKFPANDVVPLIPFKWKISVTIDFVGEVLVHGSFTCWANGDSLFQLALASVCDPCYLSGKAVNMILFSVLRSVYYLSSCSDSQRLTSRGYHER